MYDRGRTEGVFEPDEFLLVAEISVSTLRKDRTAKRASYAAAGIPNYRVVDVRGAQTFLYADPQGGEYRSETVVPFGAPIPVPGAEATIVLD
jgi:hypothetical protein